MLQTGLIKNTLEKKTVHSNYEEEIGPIRRPTLDEKPSYVLIMAAAFQKVSETGMSCQNVSNPACFQTNMSIYNILSWWKDLSSGP